jgi:Holliday junction resolvase RusA-like endonuclease
MATVEFVVYGKPQQRGSKRALPAGGKPGARPLIIDDNRKSGPWMLEVKEAAARAFSGELMMGPVILACRFYFARPKSHYNKSGVSTKAPVYHTQKPDLSKLTRCLEDALKSIIWRDDSQVFHYGTGHGKYWTDEQARVVVSITQLPERPGISAPPTTPDG